jgi:hypothetical protein
MALFIGSACHLLGCSRFRTRVAECESIRSSSARFRRREEGFAVTDDLGWQSPATPPVTGGQSPWVTPGAAPAPGPQPVPAWQQQQQSNPGWTPPPKPGLIPLRPLSFGTILGSSFRVMRRNPAPTFGLSVLLYGVITIVFLGVFGAVLAYSLSRVTSASNSDYNDIVAGTVGLFVVSALVPVSLAVIATGILQGIISLEVSRATLGQKLRVRGLWRLARGRIAPLIGWSLLLTAAIVVFLVLSSLATALVFTGVGSTSGIGIAGVIGGVLLSMLLGLAFVVLGAWLGTKLSLVPSVIMLERLTLGASMARSWSLIRNNFWRALGIQLLIAVIIYAASYVISIPISVIGVLAATLTNPNGDSSAYQATLIATYVVSGIVSAVVGAIGLVMQSASVALIYIDVRMRKEGLDLELLHYVEAKQAGTVGVDNPYLRLQAAGPAGGTQQPAGSPWA